MWHAWERRESVQGFGGKSRRKETPWKTKGGWDKMDLKETGWSGVDSFVSG
jgi:hypothetical protein